MKYYIKVYENEMNYGIFIFLIQYRPIDTFYNIKTKFVKNIDYIFNNI